MRIVLRGKSGVLFADANLRFRTMRSMKIRSHYQCRNAEEDCPVPKADLRNYCEQASGQSPPFP
jgi:hypothetical protein